MQLSQEELLRKEAAKREVVGAADPDVILELGAAKCPLLGLKSMKALRALESGRSAEKSLRLVAWMSGNELLAIYREGEQFKHWLKKA